MVPVETQGTSTERVRSPLRWQDRELFAVSTLDNRRWTNNYLLDVVWIEGRTPQIIAPTLFQKSKRKKLLVHKALQDNRWIKHILPIHTSQEMHEYVKLWEEV